MLAQACRQALTLLDYKPSYKGVLKRKERKKDGETVEKGKAKKGSHPNSEVTQKKSKVPPNTEGIRKKRQKGGVRLPKIGYTAEEWLTPLGGDDVFEPVLPGLNIPLRVVSPNIDDMSRRNIQRPTIPTKPTNPAWSRGTFDLQQQREKRQKASEDVPPPSTSQATPS